MAITSIEQVMPAECKFVLTKVAGIEQDAEQHNSAAQACEMICLAKQQARVSSSHAASASEVESGNGQWQHMIASVQSEADPNDQLWADEP